MKNWNASHSISLLWKQGFFLYIFVHFSTLQHTDFIPFLMLHDRWFYSFFRAQRSNKKTIKTSKNLYKNDPFFTYYFHLQEDQKSTSFTPWLSLIFPLIFLLFYPFWDVLKRLYFHPLIYLWTTFKTTQNPTKTPVISPYNPYTEHCNFSGLVQNFTHVCQ